MTYLNCPRCRAKYHTGVIYESLESCPRCGAPLGPGARAFATTFAARASERSRRPDWEAITGSQYLRHHLIRMDPDDQGDTTAAA